ncbi:hypothetical protein SOVF_146550 [Spinacia oleracea]|nr:hypothetical protein SOVF_146550 [Spinacia oleracea]
MGFSSKVHLFFLILLFSTFYCSCLDSSIRTISLENPHLSIKPVTLQGYTPKDNKEVLSCERVHIVPCSRLKLESYASSIRLTVAPSVVIPEKLHNRIQICLHKNASTGMCQCEKDAWKPVHKGIWGSMISPYEDKYIDVRFRDVSGSVTISAEEEFQRWRLISLAFGIFLLLAAPVVSSWVPFYYSSTMAIGILLVVIIILFQGMKLLPTGRKNFFYLTIYGSLLGAGSFLLHQFSMLVSIFLLVGVVLAGAALGYWIVRRYVISDDGSVDVGVAQFVKWAMRIIASTFILQGTPDTLFAWATVVLCWLLCSLVSSMQWSNSGYSNFRWRKARKLAPGHNRAEFLRRSSKNSPQGKVSRSPNTAPNRSNSSVRGLTSPSSNRRMSAQKNYYSSFHKMRKQKMSKKEWEEFTRESTQQAMIELTSSPEFSEWMIKNADRIQIRGDDSSDDNSDETVGSGSDSTDETVVDNVPRNGLFSW